VFSILSQLRSPHRPIQVDQNVILDFQQVGLKMSKECEALLLRSNGVQNNPAFSMQHSKRSQKSFLGTDFLNNLLSVHPRHYAYSDCHWHKWTLDITHLNDWKFPCFDLRRFGSNLRRFGGNLRHFVPNPAGSNWITLSFQVFLRMLSNMLLLWTFYQPYFKGTCSVDFACFFVWRAKGESTQLQEVSEACWAATARAIEFHVLDPLQCAKEMRFFDASMWARTFQKHLWSTHFGKTSNATKNTAST